MRARRWRRQLPPSAIVCVIVFGEADPPVAQRARVERAVLGRRRSRSDRRRLNAFAKISIVSVAAAVPAAIGSVHRRHVFARLRRGKHACHCMVTLRRGHASAKNLGCAACFFSRLWELASCLASSQRSHDSLITVTGAEAVLGEAAALE